MIIATKGYLEGTLKWIISIRENRRDISRYYRERKKYLDIPREIRDKNKITAPVMPIRKSASKAALLRAQSFIRQQKQAGLIEKENFDLAESIMSEDFVFSKKKNEEA